MKIINIIYNTIAVIIVAVFLFTVGVAVSGTGVYAVATKSMEPAISEGSAVFVRSRESYKQGDIITAELSSGNTFTHRVFRVDNENGLIYTKGDANEKPDPQPTEKEKIVGKVLFSIPYLGYLSLRFKDRKSVV